MGIRWNNKLTQNSFEQRRNFLKSNHKFQEISNKEPLNGPLNLGIY